MAARYESWYDTPRGRRFDAAQKDAVSRLLPVPEPGQTLLEAGCGTGHWARFFAQCGYEVTGLDLSPEMIAAARAQACDHCRFLVGDAVHLPVRPGSCQVAATITTLAFVSEPASVIAGLAACVEPGGTLLVGILNRLAAVNRRRVAQGREPYASARMLSPAELIALLQPLGEVRLVGAVQGHGPWARLLAWLAGGHGRRSRAPFVVAAVTRGPGGADSTLSHRPAVGSAVTPRH
jgi:SAM-dependent methyltransferase